MGVEMAGLETAKPIVVVCTRDRARATAFYRDTLGLTLTVETTDGRRVGKVLAVRDRDVARPLDDEADR